MPNYKTIRVEERVYADLALHQLPRESMSQVIKRLLQEREEVVAVCRTVEKIIEEKGRWNTNR